ncbi:MAG: anti-sigma factor [Chloroflexi bacterium]|nr:anti-sigma factor [Chloroflexota bacterium]
MPKSKATRCSEIHKLIPAFVLGSLEGEEQALVLRHLPDCPPSRRLLEEFRQVAEALPYAATLQTPALALKRRLLARLERERLAQPAHLWMWLASWGRRLAPLGPAALLLLLGLLGGWALSIQGELARQSGMVDQLFDQLRDQQLAMAFFTTGEYSRIPLQGQADAAEAWGFLMVEPDESVAMLLAYKLPALGEGQAYQLWLIRNGERDSGGLFSVDASGRAYFLFRAGEPLGAYQAVGVTVEPEEGSPGPTGPRVLAASL